MIEDELPGMADYDNESLSEISVGGLSSQGVSDSDKRGSQPAVKCAVEMTFAMRCLNDL